jgi:SAM-dependent methyltransferase
MENLVRERTDVTEEPDGCLNAEFWKSRFARFGHTGWADPVVYSFDQLERLGLIKSAISIQPIRDRGRALDFGCGSGDFSRLLLSMGFTVCGYDPFVQPRIRSARFNYVSTYDQIPQGHIGALALTVTALDHILGEDDVRHALASIRGWLRDDGVLLMLEYALDSPADRDNLRSRSDYQAFRTLSRWKDLLDETSFRILDVVGVPHPVLCPSKGYKKYCQSRFVRLRQRCSGLPVAKFWCDFFLKRHAKRFVGRFPPTNETIGPTPLKLIRCSPMPSR